MRYVAAYLLAVLGGKESPSNADIEKILSSVGIEADGTKLSKVVADLKGKSIEDLIKEGREKLSTIPVGGGVAAAAAPAAGGAPAAEAKAEKKGTLNITKTIFHDTQKSDEFFCDEHNFTIFRMNLHWFNFMIWFCFVKKSSFIKKFLLIDWFY